MPMKPSSSEEEYFQKENQRKVRMLREKAAREVKEDRDELKKLHWMRCPKCGMQLAELNFRGVEVDSCVSCGGMFLDKGEIEKAMAFKDPGWLGRAVMNFFGAEDDLGKKEE